MRWCAKHYHVWYEFKLDPQTYEDMAVAQDGGCAICGQACVSGRRLSVDHDHVTGQVRGLLCAKCNRAIGLLGDDARLVERAAHYLRRVSVRKVA